MNAALRFAAPSQNATPPSTGKGETDSPPAAARRRFLAWAPAWLLTASACASPPRVQAQAPAADGDYTPRRGQSGKDVIWVPTPDALTTRMLALASVKPSDYVVDLGSGDGKIVIAAAREFGARGLGIEFNPEMVALSERRAAAANVADRAKFQRGDIFASDFSTATVVTMYLMPHLNLRLRHTLMALKPGTRIVSHEFRLGDWQPEESSSIGSQTAHLWIVPANAGGEWSLRFPSTGAGSGMLNASLWIEQSFQTFRGRAGFKDLQTTLREPRLLGDQISFGFTDPSGQPRQFVGRVGPQRMEGRVTGGGRQGDFVAERVGNAPPINGSTPVSQTEIYGG
ncbi:MAG: methyltransferase domain-containing protein [Burkholderiaceae bacterium]